MRILIIPDQSTARILTALHRRMVDNPEQMWITRRNEWTADYQTAAQWLNWFYDCLTAKINARLPFKWGKGAKAKWRMQLIADANAECKWCGQKTGRASKQFCEDSCARSYYH